MSRSVHMDYEALRERQARQQTAMTNAIVWAHDAIHSQRQADYALARQPQSKSSPTTTNAATTNKGKGA